MDRYQEQSPDFPYIYYSLLTRDGREYPSYRPGKPSDLTWLPNDKFQAIRSGKTDYLWIPGDELIQLTEESRSTHYLSLYSLIRDNRKEPAAVVRISIDFQAWLSAMAKSFPITQDFYLLNEQGIVIGGTGDSSDPALAAYRYRTLETEGIPTKSRAPFCTIGCQFLRCSGP
ncbi:cache domain-containing protein [Paenibacillus sp. CC-CFT747]|nr:cache domain-containing protein [Paenibacillus sp. CC-CFT747]